MIGATPSVGTPPPHRLELQPAEIGRELAAIGRVRRLVRAFLEEELQPGDPSGREGERRADASTADRVLVDCVLVVSELVTNALIHTDAMPAVTIAHATHPDRIEIEVSDASPELPVARRADLGRAGGRGLHIVDRLAAAWGVREHAEGKTTWATIAVGAPLRRADV